MRELDKKKVPVASMSGSGLKNFAPKMSRAELSAVHSWVALEEKIVGDYKQQKVLFLKPSVRPTEKAPKQIAPAFGVVSTETTASRSKVSSIPQGGKSVRGLGVTLMLLGWLAAFALVLLYVQGTVTRWDLSNSLAEISREKDQLTQSQLHLVNVSKQQSEKMIQLQDQLEDRSKALQLAGEKSSSAQREWEAKYRGELMRLTTDYEMKLDLLRKTILERDVLIAALQLKIQNFEGMIGRGSMAAAAGIAPGFRAEVRSDHSVEIQGKVTLIQGRQGFFVTDLGTNGGARPGREVVITRDGKGFAVGRIERAYPTLSAVVPYGAHTIDTIREDDVVSFF